MWAKPGNMNFRCLLFASFKISGTGKISLFIEVANNYFLNVKTPELG